MFRREANGIERATVGQFLQIGKAVGQSQSLEQLWLREPCCGDQAVKSA